MQHLSGEALARLVDEEPGETERDHLEACGECQAELAALREQTGLLAALPELPAPRGEWQGVRARLAAEGLVRPARPAAGRSLLRAAAALALFVGGGATGALLRDGRVIPPTPLAAPAGRTVAASGQAVASSQQAASRLRAAEAAYLAALNDYSRHSGTDQAVDPVSRLAALEGILLTTRAALREAPADPVINGYHLAALGQRDAMLQQISTSTEEPWY